MQGFGHPGAAGVTVAGIAQRSAALSSLSTSAPITSTFG
jgi:hypothetical protein